MAEIVGPHLEQLDNWGHLEQVPNQPLDAAFWNTLALREGEASVSASASVTSNGIRIQFGEATPSVSASVSSEGIRIQFGEGNISVTATVTSDGIRIQFGASMLTGPATMTADGGILVLATFDNLAATAVMEAAATADMLGVVDALSTLVTIGDTTVEILGEDWTVVSEGAETWSEVSEGSEIWTVVSEGSEAWGEQ